MATTNPIPLQARPRRTLAEQIDRLDGILDGLAEALNQSIAQAIQDAVGLAVQQAVQAVLTEVITNPEVRTRLQPDVAEAVPNPSCPPQLSVRERFGEARARLTTTFQGAGRACWSCWRWALLPFQFVFQQAYQCASAVRRAIQSESRFQIGVIAALGVVVGVTSYLGGPWLIALCGGAGGFLAARAGQASRWLRLRLNLDPASSG